MIVPFNKWREEGGGHELGKMTGKDLRRDGEKKLERRLYMSELGAFTFCEGWGGGRKG